MKANDVYNGMPSDMRKVARRGRKEGWTWQLNNSMHYEVFTPAGVKVTTVAPRNRHWRKTFDRAVKEHCYPTR